MGGNALKNVKTVRKNRKEYFEIKDKVKNILLDKGIIIDFIPELCDKESFGDLDVLWSSVQNPYIIMRDIIIEVFKPTEIVSNGNVISFDFENFQIDMIKCSTIEFAKFYFSYGDFGSLIGKLVKKYDMTFGHNGFFIDIENHSMVLTKDVKEFCSFLKIDLEKWKSIKTKEDLFELIKSCRFYKNEYFISGNNEYRRCILHRPLYMEFLKYNGIENDIIKEKIIIDDKASIFEEAISYFNKKQDIDTILKYIQKGKDIHNKFNGNMLKERGYTGIQIGNIIKAFKIKHSNFEEWIYTTKQEDIIKSLDELIKNLEL
jgi:tetratricopeptide (TPR) repeat protein